jgi:rod shape-determining protein MreC
MLEFLRRNRLLATAALFLVLAAGMILRTGTSHGRDDQLGRIFLELMAPLERAGTFASRTVADAWESASGLLRARDEAEALRGRVRQLEQDTAHLAETEAENARLRTLLDFRRTLGGTLLTTRVIGHDAAGLSRTLVVDQGSAAGIAKGAAVLAPEGIVGQVFQVSPHAARVLLVSDHNSGVDAVVQRTRGRGIVEGTADGRCGLKFVKRTEDLQVGDLVVSSGLDGIFPRGLPIGRIQAVDKQGQGLFQYAQIDPAVDVERLEEVLVMVGAPPAPPLADDPEVPGPPPGR